MSVSDCCWHWQDTVLAAGCQRVLSIYLPIYCLYLEHLSLQCCELRFVQLGIFITIFVAKYRPLLHMFRMYVLTKPTTSPLSAFVHNEPYSLPLRVDVVYG